MKSKKKKQLKAIYNNRDPHPLEKSMRKYLDWFKPEEKLQLYKNKKSLSINLV